MATLPEKWASFLARFRALVKTASPVRYIVWSHDQLEQLFEESPRLFEAFQATINQDLAAKVRG